MAQLERSFNNGKDTPHSQGDDAPSPLLVRPMNARDTWEMIGLIQCYSNPLLSGEKQMAVKRFLEACQRDTLVAVKPGGTIVGFAIACSQSAFFQGPRGILKLVTHPNDKTDLCTQRLIRGFALQAMAAGQTKLEICVQAGDDTLEAVCLDYNALCTRHIREDTPLGPVKADILTIQNLRDYFGYGADAKAKQSKAPQP